MNWHTFDSASFCYYNSQLKIVISIAGISVVVVAGVGVVVAGVGVVVTVSQFNSNTT